MSAKLPGTRLRSGDWAFLEDVPRYVEQYDQCHPDRRRPLAEAATRRQFRTARAILQRFRVQRGVLLADDVGLGKTTVAALVACVFAGRQRRVRVLAPSAVMARRWRQEIHDHLHPLRATTRRLHLERALRTVRKDLKQLHPGQIAVSTHLKARNLGCDLLIVDEVHRARGKNSRVARRLARWQRKYGRVLFLTATPFSIDPSGLDRLLTRVGGEEAVRPSRKFHRLLGKLWRGEIGPDPDAFAKRVAEAGKAVGEAMRPFVIRHGAEGLESDERALFGGVAVWSVPGGVASHDTLGMLLHVDRLLILAKRLRLWEKTRTNDPRYHVGWSKLREDLADVAEGLANNRVNGPHVAAAQHHYGRAQQLNRTMGLHPKVQGTVRAAGEVVAAGEKVLVYCRHHATAQEVTEAVHAGLRAPSPHGSGRAATWDQAWRVVLDRLEARDEAATAPELRRHETFLKWLTAPALRRQVASWLPALPKTAQDLAALLMDIPARNEETNLSIGKEALGLWRRLTGPDALSTRAILSRGDRAQIPGGGRLVSTVCATCDGPESGRHVKADLYFPSEPDIVMAVFNSPFGPDVLVATDRMSEGIDLHAHCRHVIHHELDPSPIRTIQRNGRVRRVNSWAARTNRPIRIAYPAFENTRDAKLVQLMQQRLAQFDLLLGGLGESIAMDAPETSSIQTDVLDKVKARMGEIDLRA